MPLLNFNKRIILVGVLLKSGHIMELILNLMNHIMQKPDLIID